MPDPILESVLAQLQIRYPRLSRLAILALMANHGDRILKTVDDMHEIAVVSEMRRRITAALDNETKGQDST